MKILILYGKHGNVYFDASTPEKELAAYRAIFNNHLEESYYEEETHKGSLLQATIDDEACKTFVRYRSSNGFEYERVEAIYLIDATEKR